MTVSMHQDVLRKLSVLGHLIALVRYLCEIDNEALMSKKYINFFKKTSKKDALCKYLLLFQIENLKSEAL